MERDFEHFVREYGNLVGTNDLRMISLLFMANLIGTVLGKLDIHSLNLGISAEAYKY